jgi:tRNA pseudouridine38-40 synthase
MRAFRVAYDGTDYRGYQRQPHGDTVEDTLLAALRRLGVCEGVPEGWASSGRTDAGVSAIAQTVAFAAPDWLTPAAFNGELPPEIRAWASAEAPADFHATHHATRRAYEYHLHAPDLDDGVARRACETLSGTHDFHNLSPDSWGTERDLDASCERDGAFLVCRFESDGFPREFVRRAVALVALVAAGDQPFSYLERALSEEVLEGKTGFAPAAPEPLLLTRVEYPTLDFEVDDRAAASAWAAFEERRVRQQTAACVSARLRAGSSREP